MSDTVSLGDAAAQALDSMGDEMGAQQVLDGTDYAKVKFVGMSYDSLETEFKIGDEATFLVRARCVGSGDEEMRDGHIRHVVKMDVRSVIVQE